MSCDKREANNTPSGEILNWGEDDSKEKKAGGLLRQCLEAATKDGR